MAGVFKFSKNFDYNLRSSFHLENSNMHTVDFGNEFIGFLGAKSGNSFPST